MLQLMHSFQGLTVPKDVLNGVRDGLISSFCLFAYTNVESPLQVYDLTTALHQAAAEGGQPPPIIGIDQEGGQLIAIVKGATELPGNMALGATRSPKLAQQAGMVLGRELMALGINLNFAPAMDVNTNPRNPVIGIRSFGDDPELVAMLGSALIQGMQEEGVIAAAKHFPGHGDTESDSHAVAPTVKHSLQYTKDIDLLPFRAAIEANTQAILTAHILYPVLDANNPATLSRPIMETLLRDEMGFRGLTITDAMDMYAVAQYGTIPSVTRALQAGLDLILLGHIPDQLQLHESMKAYSNPVSVKRIQDARSQLRKEHPPLRVVGCKEHQDIAQAIADASITAVRSAQLPLKPTSEQHIAVITPQPADLTPADTSSQVKIRLVEHVRARHSFVQGIEIDMQPNDQQISQTLEATRNADIIIVGTIAADHSPGQAALIKAFYERGQSPIVIAMRTPYDLDVVPMIDTYLCTYSIRPVSMEAVTKVLFGEIEAQGVLPCAIQGIVHE